MIHDRSINDYTDREITLVIKFVKLILVQKHVTTTTKKKNKQTI